MNIKKNIIFFYSMLSLPTLLNKQKGVKMIGVNKYYEKLFKIIN